MEQCQYGNERELVIAYYLTEGFLMSFLIEMLQLLTIRTTDIDDLITNTLGAILGYWIAMAIFRNAPEEETAGDRIKLLVIILLPLLVIFFVRYPLIAWIEEHCG